MSQTALDKSIAIAGGQAALAAMVSRPDGRPVTQQAVSWWVQQRRGMVPDYAVLDIERGTGVSRNELRPDIYGPPAARASAVEATAGVGAGAGDHAN